MWNIYVFVSKTLLCLMKKKNYTKYQPCFKKSIYEASQLEDKVRVVITQDLRCQARKDRI